MSEQFRNNALLLRAVREVIHQMHRRLLRLAAVFGALSIVGVLISTQFDDFRHAWFFGAALVAAGIVLGLIGGILVAESLRYPTNV